MIAEFGAVNGSQFFIAGLSFRQCRGVVAAREIIRERIENGLHIRDRRSD